MQNNAPECECGARQWIIKDIDITGVTDDGGVEYNSAEVVCEECTRPYMNLRK